MRTSKILLTVLLLAFCMIATSAMAAPITSWNYDLKYYFSDWNDGVETNNNQTTLSWGGNSGSSISVEGTNAVSDETFSGINDEPKGTTSSGTYDSSSVDKQLAMTFSHDNKPISGNSTALEWATLTSKLTLSVDGKPVNDKMPWEEHFNIKFWETPNTAPKQVKQNILQKIFGIPGSIKYTGDVDDIFYLVNSDDLTTTFQLDDYLYTLTFTINDLMDLNLTGLTEKERRFLGFGVDLEFSETAIYQGLRTPENQYKTFGSHFSITSEYNPINNPVPEPGTMILFGMGMIGMAGAIRRKRTA